MAKFHRKPSNIHKVMTLVCHSALFEGKQLLTNRCQRARLHMTLKMTSAQVVETSVTNNSSFQNYTHPDDHTIGTTDTPGFKPITIKPEIVKNARLPFNLNVYITKSGK